MAIRHALRSLRRTPGFTLAVILTLVLGIASVGSMFAVVHGVLLAPLPYGEPDRLVSVGMRGPEAGDMAQPPAVHFTYRQRSRSLVDVGFYRTGSANLWVDGHSDVADNVTATWVTASTISLLQVPLLLGRSFTAEEELRGGPDAVVLSESEWRDRFDAATDVIGKTLIVNSVPRQIVGIMPARFAFPSADTRVWLPVKHTESMLVGDFWYRGVARLAAGTTTGQAQHELAAVLPSMAESFSRLQSGGSTRAWLDEVRPTPVVVPLRDAVTDSIAHTLWVLAAAAGLVLLVAWANVGNLMMIRADVRQRELAVRAAMGASRLRIASHFIGEWLLLGAAAGALALLVVFGAVRALVAFGPADVPRLTELGVGPATVGFVALMTMLGMITCAVVPMLRNRFDLERSNPLVRLHDGGRAGSTGKSRQRFREAVVAVQIAVALVVTCGSVLLLRTTHSLHSVQPGFEASNVTTVWTLLPFARYRDASSVAFHAQLTESVGQLPFVRAVGLTTKVPFGAGRTLEQTFRAETSGRTLPLSVTVIDAGYFAAMGIPWIAGRNFQRLDQERGEDIIINQRAAGALFNDPYGDAALGQRLTLAPAGPTYTIIGIVGDVRDSDLAIVPNAMVYRPQVVPNDPAIEPGAQHAMALVVRTNGPGGAIVPAIRQIVRELDPTIPIYRVETMSEVVRASTSRHSFVLALVSVAAVIALLLGAIGLSGVMTYMVSLRSREFGVRMALGAEPRRIARSVVMRGLVIAVGGIGMGLVLYTMSAPFLRAFLFGVTVADPMTLAGSTFLLLATAFLASWVPARRAARVDPVEAIRAE